MIDRLIARVFETRNAAHLAHWATTSFAKHMALAEFYSGLPEKLDAIVEAYQGGRGLLVSTNYQPVKANPANIAEHIKAEAEWLVVSRDDIAVGLPSVANMLDDLHGHYLVVLYKLRFLD